VKLRKTLAAAGALAISAGMFAAQPSSAAVTADTEITVTLTATGDFAIASGATATGTGAAAPGAVITANMPTTTVTDTRGTLAGWTVNGTSEDLVAPDPGAIPLANRTIPKANMVWATGTVTATAGLLTGVGAGAGGSMALDPFVIATGATLAGNGEYEYDPTVTVTLPAATNLIAGDYSGTVTQSLI
jgi:hypothetical protein